LYDEVISGALYRRGFGRVGVLLIVLVCLHGLALLACGEFELTHALTFEFDPVSVVNDAVQDGVSEGWIADDLVHCATGSWLVITMERVS